MADGIFHDFFGGLISGSAGVLVGHPFDTVKVQLQVQARGNSYKNVWDCIDTIKKQTWSKGFFRGLSWPMLSAGVINSVFFGSYNQILKVMGTSADKQHDHPDYLKIAIASGMAGVFQLIIACPIEVIKVVLQSQIPHGNNKGLKFYKGPVEGVVDIVKHRGFSGMFRGLSSQLPRDVIASSIYFTVFEFTSYEGNRHLKSVPHPVINFMAGGLAGVVSWHHSAFDVLKSRM
ncbi:SLC25A45_47 [Mytilus coruscus]|uniref:SLC25A45_47 n=1 Tax=Mytilus coruscus TaxID=42192 RepID=A0A6J8AV09_MYTCO|nr:SLC25A45_47 [Mytilus coruscus]